MAVQGKKRSRKELGLLLVFLLLLALYMWVQNYLSLNLSLVFVFILIAVFSSYVFITLFVSKEEPRTRASKEQVEKELTGVAERLMQAKREGKKFTLRQIINAFRGKL